VIIITIVYIYTKTIINIKNIFGYVSRYKINIGRGGNQKAHVLSSLDLRLSYYM
jgi:hypothetical protein